MMPKGNIAMIFPILLLFTCCVWVTMAQSELPQEVVSVGIKAFTVQVTSVKNDSTTAETTTDRSWENVSTEQNVTQVTPPISTKSEKMLETTIETTTSQPSMIVDTAALLQGTMTRSAPKINHPIVVESMESLSNEIHDDKKETRKVNIDDFYPSKMEDFKLVIQQSNEKILREKNAIRTVETMDLMPIINNKKDLLMEDKNKSDISTTNIEIELIEDPSDTTMKSPIDLTEKLQENDDVIRHIEESFQIDDMDLRPDIIFEPSISSSTATTTTTTTTTTAATSTTTAKVVQKKKKVHIPDLIPRRVKKNDPSTKISILDRATLKKIDFANTKFKSHTDDLKHTELSTTKFYNSKELENPNKKQDIKKVKKISSSAMATTTTNTIATPTKTTTTTSEENVSTGASTTIIQPVVSVSATTATSTTTMEVSTFMTSSSSVKPPAVIPLYRNPPIVRPRILTRLEEKINQLDCELATLPTDATIWRGNETHELNLPIMKIAHCMPANDAACLPTIISWEATADIQSGDVLLVEIDDSKLIAAVNPVNKNSDTGNLESMQHHSTPSAAVYQVTRPGHEHCDITEGELLDITPLIVDGKKLVTLYDKDLTEGVNFLIVVSDMWGQQCVRLKVTVKSDNCGEAADCSSKGICYSNKSMEGYECQCCTGFSGSHCEEIDACTPSPCTNNGICVDLSQGHEGNSYQCLCPYGYTGKNCQFETDPCNPSQCMNGGTCVGNSTHFRCECVPGYTGPLCQHNLNECESSPCVHGICVDQEDGFRCFCQPGYAGELCNYEYNECESNPCLNGGQCIDHISGFSCKCTPGYTGKRCHVKVDFCANDPCPDGHRCIDHGDDFSCECPGGRNGPDCNQVPRTLCNVNPCANGGTCWTTEESFYCACRPGFTGKMCQDTFFIESVVNTNELLSDLTPNAHIGLEGGSSMMQSPFEIHSTYIAIGTLAVAICIVAVVITVCHCKVHQTYRHFTPKKLIPIHFGRRVAGVSAGVDHHWLKGKAAGIQNDPGNSYCTNNLHIHNGAAFTNNDRISRPLPPINLDSEMYYTVDFSDSQNSPLIQ